MPLTYQFAYSLFREFDVEWEHDAEVTVADMEFTGKDSPEDRRLKLQVLRLYNGKLGEQKRVVSVFYPNLPCTAPRYVVMCLSQPSARRGRTLYSQEASSTTRGSRTPSAPSLPLLATSCNA